MSIGFGVLYGFRISTALESFEQGFIGPCRVSRRRLLIFPESRLPTAEYTSSYRRCLAMM